MPTPRLLLSAALAAALSAALSLPGCERVPDADVTFVIHSEHNDMDPQQISWLHDGRIATHLFEPLLRYDSQTHEIEPAVAESWDVSDDGRTYTFHLRPDAQWSNGDPVTADDFVYAWRRAMLPDTAANYAKLFLNHVEGAQVFFDWRQEQLREFAEVRAAAQAQTRREAVDQIVAETQRIADEAEAAETDEAEDAEETEQLEEPDEAEETADSENDELSNADNGDSPDNTGEANNANNADEPAAENGADEPADEQDRDPAAAEQAAELVWEMTEQKFEETVGVTAVNDHTLVVQLERPTPYFLSLVSFVTFLPVHVDSVEQATTLDPDTGHRRTETRYWTNPSTLVSNGPYQLESRRFRQHVHMTANPYYWDAASLGNASLTQRIIPDHQSALTEYRRGRIDLWPGVPTGSIAAQLVRSDRDDVHTQDMAGTYFYNFNCNDRLPDGRENPFADLRVRRAFAMAIDRETLVESVTELNQNPALSYIPEDVIDDYAPPVEHGITFDPQRARELLAQAGYPDGEGLRGLEILYNTGAEHGPIAQAIASMWQEHLNVRVSLDSVEVGTFRERLEGQDYIIARASWFGDYPDPSTFLDRMTTDDGNNHTGWSNSRYDTLVQRAREESDPQRRLEILREAEQIILHQQPMALIFQYRFVNLYDPQRLENVQTNAWADWRLDRIRVRDNE